MSAIPTKKTKLRPLKMKTKRLTRMELHQKKNRIMETRMALKKILEVEIRAAAAGNGNA